MPKPSSLILAVALGIAACRDPAVTGTLRTQLSGIVLRGPVTPVCQVQVPCDAPFGAGFTVREGARVVTAFRSNAQGQFQVALLPGTYVVVPDPDAPLMSPGTQLKTVVVGHDSVTRIELDFDTGIR
jgi:hypothetical protein